MKRFLLFVIEPYYPSGGWDDFKKDYAILEEAHAAGQAWRQSSEGCGQYSYHIVDTQSWTKVEQKEE